MENTLLVLQLILYVSSCIFGFILEKYKEACVLAFLSLILTIVMLVRG